MEMICLLPKAKREIADPHIATVVSFVKTADENDPGLKALRCMGRTGFQAIRAELNEPKHLKKPIAARALALMNAKDAPDAEVLEVASQCAQDQDTEVRTLCSQTLGHIGAPALPKILELLQSGDKELKDAGRIALQNFDDPEARDELQKIRADNSGWMANNKKLEIAKAVGTALQKLQTRAEPQG
jgi:HEAT repeat protein